MGLVRVGPQTPPKSGLAFSVCVDGISCYIEKWTNFNQQCKWGVIMIIVNTREAKTNLSKWLSLVSENHETVRICRYGKVVADLVEPTRLTEGHLAQNPKLKGVVFKEDPASPLPEEFSLNIPLEANEVSHASS